MRLPLTLAAQSVRLIELLGGAEPTPEEGEPFLQRVATVVLWLWCTAGQGHIRGVIKTEVEPVLWPTRARAQRGKQAAHLAAVE